MKKEPINIDAYSIIKLVILLLIILLVFVSYSNRESKKGNNQRTYQDSTENETMSKKVSGMEKTYAWYIDNIPNINTSLNNLLAQNGVSGYISASTQLKFDSDLGVYYLVNYTGGKKNGRAVSGHARAFVKYQDSNIQWFSLEIGYDSNPFDPIVDWYKDEYDSIVENYYFDLQKQVN